MGDTEARRSGNATSMFLRGITRQDAERFRLAAKARGWTLGYYLSRLLDLHNAIRARADAGDKELRQVLDVLGLRTVER